MNTDRTNVNNFLHLVRTKLKLKLKRHRIKKAPNRKRFNTVKLQELETRKQF